MDLPIDSNQIEEEKDFEKYNENKELLDFYYEELNTTENRERILQEMSPIINDILMYLLKYNGLKYVLEILYEFVFEKDFILTKELFNSELPNIEKTTEDIEKTFIRIIFELFIINIKEELDDVELSVEEKTIVIIHTLFNRLNEKSGGSSPGSSLLNIPVKFVTVLASLSALIPSVSSSNLFSGIKHHSANIGKGIITTPVRIIGEVGKDTIRTLNTLPLPRPIHDTTSLIYNIEDIVETILKESDHKIKFANELIQHRFDIKNAVKWFNKSDWIKLSETALKIIKECPSVKEVISNIVKHNTFKLNGKIKSLVEYIDSFLIGDKHTLLNTFLTNLIGIASKVEDISYKLRSKIKTIPKFRLISPSFIRRNVGGYSNKTKNKKRRNIKRRNIKTKRHNKK